MENKKLIVTEYAIPEKKEMLGDCQAIYTDGVTFTSFMGKFDINHPCIFGWVLSDRIKTDHKFYDGRKGNKIIK
jgi:hypothetical protein